MGFMLLCCQQAELRERQRVLPIVTVNSSLRGHATPSLLSTTTTTTTTPTSVTTTVASPSGELAGSRVLPPVNVSEVLSKDQLRQQTERVYWHAVHKGAMPTHTNIDVANTTGRGDSVDRACDADTVGATESENVINVSDSESSCDTLGENKMLAEVSANIGSDNVDV